MRLSKTFIAKVGMEDGDEASFTLTTPTAEQANDLLLDLYEATTIKDMKERKKKLMDTRGAFFDGLLIAVDNLEDEAGPITPERKAEIPLDWKSSIIFQRFELTKINIKNS